MIKKLIVYLREFRRDAILAPTLIVLEVVCELLLPLLMERIIDVGINGGGGMTYIYKAGFAMLGMPPTPARASDAICARPFSARCSAFPLRGSTGFPPPLLSPGSPTM